ncbi:hypothetical protein [Halomonas sp. 707B3]|uniref:hypothetical protein n=1 Tax=Halomonas sp. 707B3 TaxID=1681043 RepID=UPI0020A1FA7C|nr:hypothetical protein [Halomonas sp. 707B3]MCP1316416.1 hypothetical protein [Halomonas sp. 707B3]
MSQNEPVMSQRERFEAKCGYYPWMLPIQRWESTGEYVNLETKRAWAIWQAACPEGWQALPRAATPEMLDCIHDWTRHTEERYAALLEVAPKPEDACKSPD